MTTEKYNGWTNYETWNFALWEDSDYWHEIAQECYDEAESDDVFSRMDNARLELKDRIESYLEELQDNQNMPTNGFFADILGAAIQKVNCYELAESWMDEVEEEEEEDD